MSEIWFTADQHFGHENIIDYCQRPWQGNNRCQIMDKDLVEYWNNSVGENDTVYHLGDLSIKGKSWDPYYEKLISKLKGNIHLILGNHDIFDPKFYVKKGIISVHYPYLKVEEFYCVHDPALSRTDKNSQFLCGHIHDLFLKSDNCLNVGVDVHHYVPINIENVRELFKL